MDSGLRISHRNVHVVPLNVETCATKNLSSRKHARCEVFEVRKEISCRPLPTYEGVMQHYLWVRYDMKRDKNYDPGFGAKVKIAVTEDKYLG